MPSPELAPPPIPGHAADATIEEQWRRTAAVWNERARERINSNRARLGMATIQDVLDHVLTDHTWLAADTALAPVPETPGREIFQTGAWVLADDTPLAAEVRVFLERGAPPRGVPDDVPAEVAARRLEREWGPHGTQ